MSSRTSPSLARDAPQPAGRSLRRREELLDGLMTIIAARGFAEVPVAEMARELSCSLATIYRLAPSKDSLVVLAIGRWGELALRDAETRAEEGTIARERLRAYLRAGARAILPQSHAFRRDVERYESTRVAYRVISDRYVDRVAELIAETVRSGDARPVNPRLMAGLLRHLARAVRDEDMLEAAGVTAGEALLEIEGLLLEGLRPPSDGSPSGAAARG